MRNTENTIRSMTKSELAKLYLPDHTNHSAVNTLVYWIAYNRPLTEALQNTGYRKTQKLLTAKQVELIYEYLGEP